ncbi:hypothetical protein [Paracoccus hibiscisoli]|uniref:Uncharacterized protein n=1 Tax=Paracoccus hibiscisoli TaxID=2023261 RepID=A0A4U0QUY5_9RHOB|nr:hypothetical protein [Paracoccus hibiscisoli]TJZ85816.1 hypothetical protein FA740_05295 [Paracoccus hibiscisoli]
MDGYWRDDLSQAKRSAILADWCDELEDWPLNSIQAAFRKHRRDRPDKKPNPGHILQLLNKAWGEHNAPAVRAAMAATQEAPREPISAERASAILEELGFAVKRVEPTQDRATNAEVKRQVQELQATPEGEP